ncbi:hypothetical protein GCM10009639_64220 [Kitasatospora putterlickiae]|uniref:Transposase n=1 Tax=Kitasatospora putterlickiae TaxID=221725 RepID=A0ABP4J4I4_9ACTN
MTTDLNTLLTALYVKIDDGIGGTRCPGQAAVAQRLGTRLPGGGTGLLGFHSEARWLCYANRHMLGISALEQFLGGAAGLSVATVTRLTRQWQDDHAGFQRRDLSQTDGVYVWADGAHPKVRLGRA